MDQFDPVTDWEYERLMQIMSNNADRSFVKRILNPTAYPVLDEGDGKIATHRMSWAQAGDRFFAFPTVLLGANGKLKDYGDSAWDQAVKTGNYIEFDNPDEASWFTQRYKGAWAGKKNQPPR
jgi:hypothetical protein